MVCNAHTVTSASPCVHTILYVDTYSVRRWRWCLTDICVFVLDADVICVFFSNQCVTRVSSAVESLWVRTDSRWDHLAFPPLMCGCCLWLRCAHWGGCPPPKMVKVKVWHKAESWFIFLLNLRRWTSDLAWHHLSFFRKKKNSSCFWDHLWHFFIFSFTTITL